MAITTLLDPALLPARTMDQDTFNAAMAYLMTNMPIWGMQTNAIQANLNSIAAGGAYAIPYTFDGASNTAGDPGSGKLRLSVIAGQSVSTAIYINTTNSLGAAVALTLASFGDSTSAVKGVIKLYKQGDASKWLRFSVTAIATGAYYTISLIPINGSAANPFVNGDALLLDFQRTGDKGDTNSGSPTLHLREERASGTGSTAPTNLGTGVNRRPLNTVKVNTITGASLASDQFVLPAGTYDVEAESLSFVQTGSTGQKYWNKMALYNVTDAAYVVIGLNGLSYDPASNGLYVQMSPPSLAGTFAIAASKTFELRHLTPNAAMYGVPASSSGQVEVYTDLVIRKTS